MSHDSETGDIDVEITVRNHDPDEQQQRVLDTYESNIETFIRKNSDYGGSFEHTAKVESILKHGEVRDGEIPEIVSKQIFVRGFMDKVSRFYQLTFENDDVKVGDESVRDTLLDLGNYSHMLAALLDKYDEQSDEPAGSD